MNCSRSVRSRLARSLSRGALVISALTCLSMIETPAFGQYKRADLVSNQAGAAPTQDAHLVNGWALLHSPQVRSG